MYENERKLDNNGRPFFSQLCAQRWLSVRLEFIGAMIIFFTSLFGVTGKGSINPSLILSLSISLLSLAFRHSV